MRCKLCGNPVTFQSLDDLCLHCTGAIIRDYEQLAIENKRLQEELLEERKRIPILIDDLRDMAKELRTNKKVRTSRIDPEVYAELVKDLGTASNPQLAKKYGLDQSTVWRLCQKYKVQKFDPYRELWLKVDPIIFERSSNSLSKEFEVERRVFDRRRQKLRDDIKKVELERIRE